MKLDRMGGPNFNIKVSSKIYLLKTNTYIQTQPRELTETTASESTDGNTLLNQCLAEDNRSVKTLISKDETLGNRTEFGTAYPDRISIIENDELEAIIDPLVPVDEKHVACDTDFDRPLNQTDQSSYKNDGSIQATTAQLCNMGTTNWAERIIGLQNENPAHTRTQVHS